MALPPVAKTPVMLMRFTPKANDIVISAVIEALTQGGIIVVESEGLYDKNGKIVAGSVGYNAKNPVVLGLTTTQNLLEHEAEKIVRLVKPCRTPQGHMPITIIMEPFSSIAREDFINVDHKNEEDHDEDGLFTSGERALLLESMIAAIPCPEPLEPQASDKEHTSTLREALHLSGYIDVVAPIHIPHIKKKIEKETYSIMTPPPLQAIRDYYGEGVAFYFAWMHHMTCWYVIPGLLGLAVYVVRKYRGDTVDNCELTPFVGLITFCWAVVCTNFWTRCEAKLAYKWGTYSSRDENWRSLGVRPGFTGKMKRSPVTGRMERYYPAYKRKIKYAVSAFITLFLLGCACLVMIISMNLQGYVTRKDKELWGDEQHPLYFPFFAQLAEEGGIFDATSAWKSFLPIILRALVVVNMNAQYSRLAEALAEWENHRTIKGHNNSVILKRVLFEAFDAYIILFYLAIYERDVVLLRLELVGAFSVDSLRRILMECVIPYTVQKYFKSDIIGISKKNDDLKKERKTSGGHLTTEADLEDYDTFDDYIEMLIQFGYCTLFASAYPLASCVAIGANIIEIRADLWKLAHLFRRATPVRTNDIGSWEWSLIAFAWLAAGSNLIIFAFTSSQLRQWLPDYFVTDELSGQPVPKASSANEILLIVMAIEHIILIVALLLKQAIPSTPESVCVELQKRIWYHERVTSDARKLTLKETSMEVKTITQGARRNSFPACSEAFKTFEWIEKNKKLTKL